MSHQSNPIAADIETYLAEHERKDLLRLLVCGSVDDGKSTLIGRLLYDSKMIYQDQLESLKVDSGRYGTTDGEFDPALLTDGLRAEREQGITIDVAYRYFSTSKRKFIIADTPGHEQYTRNMATGASTSDLAVILVDARNGVSTQTRRHAFIASLLGIKHVVLAVNKMDLVNYSQASYDAVVKDVTEFATKLDIGDLRFVPVAALTGDNIVNTSAKIPWYSGSPLMEILDTVSIASDENLTDFRFPVQYVNRPDAHFRGFCGTVASGTVRPGDEVMVLPSRKTSCIEGVHTFEGRLHQAVPPLAVTLTLEDQIDISRGDMLVHPNNLPMIDQQFDAMVVWMAEQPLRSGNHYFFKQTTNMTPGTVSQINFMIDVNTLHRQETAALALNEIGRCVIEVDKPVAFDTYRDNRSTGSFIVIDRITNDTVGAGMIIERVENADAAPRYSELLDQQPGAKVQSVSARRPVTVWISGLSGSGKSSIAEALERQLVDKGFPVYRLDGDAIRTGLNKDLTFSRRDRGENIRRIAEVAKLFNRAGLVVLVPVISPFERDRRKAEEIVGTDNFFEVFVDTPLSVCEERDVKGLYRLARAGRIGEFTGVSSPYEPPINPDLRVTTENRTVSETAREVFECIESIIRL